MAHVDLAMVGILEQRVAGAVAAGRFPVVYGGDCTTLLGVTGRGLDEPPGRSRASGPEPAISCSLSRSPRSPVSLLGRSDRCRCCATSYGVGVTRLLNDLPPYIYGTTRLGHADVPRPQQAAMARSAIDAGLWLHTSRQYDHALEVLAEAFDADRSKVPPLVVKLGGGTAADVRGTLAENMAALRVDSITLGQLNPVDELAEGLVDGGEIIGDLQAIKAEGLVDRFLLEIFPWTSTDALRALRAGHLDDLVDGYIFYLNPLQRFASNELWDELLTRDASIVAMRTVSGAPVHVLRDVPGAAWKPYLRDRAAEVAPLFERSGISSWADFCIRFAYSHPQVVSTVGSASRQEHLDELIAYSRHPEPLPQDLVDEIHQLQRRWSDEVDVHAPLWSM